MLFLHLISHLFKFLLIMFSVIIYAMPVLVSSKFVHRVVPSTPVSEPQPSTTTIHDFRSLWWHINKIKRITYILVCALNVFLIPLVIYGKKKLVFVVRYSSVNASLKLDLDCFQ
ncbi:hypothetical protein RND81_09G062500 [Saponaria officinalis]|uniref:Uncharacterized protein n=1 Tax=Saponaria officinalis TaxID=3572 RepID=A0AAW1IJ81_SAPOF